MRKDKKEVNKPSGNSSSQIELQAIKDFLKRNQKNIQEDRKLQVERKKAFLLAKKMSETNRAVSKKKYDIQAINDLLQYIPDEVKLKQIVKVLESVKNKNLSAKYILLRNKIIKPEASLWNAGLSIFNNSDKMPY